MDTWGTKRKYGERSSSCASSAGSMDSRLSEDFGDVHRRDNRPSLLLSVSPSPPRAPRPLPLPPYKKLRLFSKEEPSEAALQSCFEGPAKCKLPGPSNVSGAYYKMRATIKAITATYGTDSEESADHSSSCASISFSVEDPCNSENPAEKSKATQRRHILSRMRVAVIKWQSRVQFLNLTSPPDTTHGLRRKRIAADELLSTGSNGNEWASLVARRFTKTTLRQIAGLQAILELHAEEENYYASGSLDRILRPGCPSRAHELLKLVFEPFDPPFFQHIVPHVLRDWPVDMPRTITWLARFVPGFWSHLDGGEMARYGRRVIQISKPWTDRWMDGMWLLSALVKERVPETKDKSTTLSVAKDILHVGMEALGNVASNSPGDVHGPEETARLNTLHLIILTCLHSEGEHSISSIVPSTTILGPFVEFCVNAVQANGPVTCSALKALALLRDIPTALEDRDVRRMSLLTAWCIEIILGRGRWKKSLLLDKCNRIPYTSIPDEDAFDILCRLPQPRFSQALAAALGDCPVSLDPSSQDHLQLFEILEPLLWLSNMPSSVPEAHRALVEGGATDFLSRIVLDSPQETWAWQDRAVWRLRGEAITCLGNIIEKMDEADLRARIKDDVIKAVVDIRENQEAPLFQRDQATFALHRYKYATDRCGIVPFCAGMLGQESSNGI